MMHLDNDGSHFFNQQLLEEQKLSSQLNLKEKTMKKLRDRGHSLHAIKAFQLANAQILEQNNILYILPVGVDSHSYYDRRLSGKIIYTLDSYEYCLLNKEEYKRALQDEVSQDSFLDLRSKNQPTKSSFDFSTTKIKKEPSFSLKTPAKKEYPDAVDAVFDTLTEQRDKKKSNAATHLHRIVSFGGSSCVEENEERAIQVEKPRQYDQRVILALKKEYETEVKLQKELARVQLKIATKHAASLKVTLEKLRAENEEKDTEIARLKQTMMRPIVFNTNSPTKRTKSSSPVKRTNKKQNTKKGTKAHQQQARLVGTDGEAPLDPVALAEAEKRAEEARLAEQMRLAESMATQDAYYESLMRPYVDGPTNIGIVVPSMVRLQAYLTMFLKATRVPNANSAIRGLLDHHFLLNYRLSLCYNVSSYDTHSDYERASLEIQRKREAMDVNSFSVRYNLSNVLVHTAFIKKAIEFSQTESMQHRPIILSNFPHTYAAEILQKWYPNLNCGNGYIITPDLKIPAVASLQGQGHNKHCCYCGLQYIACSNGVLKHAHQVKNCDYIANHSNDERATIMAVLTKAEIDEELRDHAFICKRDETSLFRLATQDEEISGAYVVSPLTGEHLRINMPVLLRMRERTYMDMIARITSLDTHKTEMNLNAVPFAYQLDCFGLSAPRFQKTKKPTKKQLQQKQTGINKIQKEDGFLYKTLIDYSGLPFRRSKFTPDGKTTLRSFALNEDGFGDDMFFSMIRARSHEELDEEVERNLFFNMNNLNFGFAPEPLMIEAGPQPQQQLFLPAPTLEEEEEVVVIEEMLVDGAVEDAQANRLEPRIDSPMELSISYNSIFDAKNTNDDDDDEKRENECDYRHSDFLWPSETDGLSFGQHQYQCDASFFGNDDSSYNHEGFDDAFAPTRRNTSFNSMFGSSGY